MKFVNKKLDNGLEIIIAENEKISSTEVYVHLHAGKDYEKESEVGIFHLLEHLNFASTLDFPKKNQALESVKNIGGKINAHTTSQMVFYEAKVLDEDMEIALHALSQIVFHTMFDKKHFDQEKNVIKNEMTMNQDNPNRFIQGSLLPIVSAAVGNYNFSEKSLNNLESISLEDVIDKYKEFYCAKNATIFVNSNLETEKIMGLIKKYFSDVPAGKKQKLNLTTHDRIPKLLVNKNLNQMHLAFSLPSDSIVEGPVASSLAKNIIHKRLYRELRKEKGLVYNIISNSIQLNGYGYNSFYTNFNPKNEDEIAKDIEKIINDIYANGFTEGEFEINKKSLLASAVFSDEDQTKKALRIFNRYFLTGKIRTTADLINEIKKISLLEINSYSKKYFNTDNIGLVIIGNRKEG